MKVGVPLWMGQCAICPDYSHQEAAGAYSSVPPHLPHELWHGTDQLPA